MEKTKRQLRDELMDRVEKLRDFAYIKNIPLQFGELHRPYFVAVEYVRQKVGILNSKHRQSLAIDIWITSPAGEEILWQDGRYKDLADFWVSIGGTAGYYFKKKDAYHFE